MLLTRHPRGSALLIKYDNSSSISYGPGSSTPVCYNISHTAQSHGKLAEYVDEAHFLISIFEKHKDAIFTERDVYGRTNITLEPVQHILLAAGWEQFGQDWKKVLSVPKKEKPEAQKSEKTTCQDEGPISPMVDWEPLVADKFAHWENILRNVQIRGGELGL